MDAAAVARLLGEPAADITVCEVPATDGFTLRVYSFLPHAATSGPPVVFIPGWTSVMDGWAPLLGAWVAQREIHYIETREKVSAEIERPIRKEDFTMERHVADIAAVVGHLGLDGEVLWFGSSLGATVILEGLRSGELQGRGGFLLSPNTAFRFSLWMRPLIAMPWWLYPPLIRVAIVYLKWRLKEPGQYIRYRRTLRNAHIRRLKRSVGANRCYALSMELADLIQPVAICVAASDTLHTEDDAHRIAKALPNGTLVEVPSNQYAHEANVIADIDAWEASVRAR